MSIRYTKSQIDSLASFLAKKIKDRIGGFRVDSVAALVESERAAQGLGTLWSAGDMIFEEAGPLAVDHHLTTSSGVKLYEAGAKYTARSRFVQAVAREFPFTTNEYVHAEGFWYTYDGGTHIVDLDGFSPAIATVLNPKQFAARGNGIADDLVPIKAMLAYGATIAVIAYWSPEGKNPAEQRIIYDFSGSVYAVSGEILLEAENSYSLIKNPQIIAIAGSWSTTGTDVIQLKAPGSDFTVKLDSYIFKMKVGCGYVTFLYPDLNCNGLCGGIFARGRAVVYRPDIRRIGYTHGALEGSVGIWAALGDVHIRDGWVGQWDQSDAEYYDKDAYGAIGVYTADSDITVIGTKFRWSYANIVLSGTNHRFVQIHSFNGMRSYSWNERNAADAEVLDAYFGFDTSAYNFPVRTYHSGVHAVAKTLEGVNNKFADSTFEDCYFDNCHMETEADGVVFRNPKLGAKPTSSLSAPGATYIDGTPVSPEGTIDYWWNNHAYEDNAVPRLAVYGVQPYVEGTVKKAIKWTDTDDYSWAKDGLAWQALNDNLMDETHGDGFRMGSAHTNLNTDNSRASVLYYSIGDNSAIRFADDATSRNVAGDELDAFTLIGSTGDHLKLRASKGSVYTGNVLPALLGNSANGFVVGSGTSGVGAVDDDADDLIIQNSSDAGISVAVPRDSDVRLRAVTRNEADDGDEVRGELQFDTSADLVKLKVNETDVADFGPAGKATSVKPYFSLGIGQSNMDGNQYASGGNMDPNRHCKVWDQDSSGNPMVAGTQFLPAEIGTAPYNSTEIGTGDPLNYFTFHTMKHIQEVRGGETYLVQVAQGSTPIEAWMHDDDLAANGWTLGGGEQDLYPFMIDALTAARADVPGTPDFLDLIMICHGNANSDDGPDLYAYKLQVVLDRLVTEGFASYESTKIVVGELAHGSAADIYKGTRQQKALRRLANNPDKTNKFDVGIVSAKGIPITASTPAHFSGEGLVQLGYRYGRAALMAEEAPDDWADPDRFNPNYGLNWAVKDAFIQNREQFRRPPENLGDVPVETENSHAVLGTCYKAAAGDAIVLSDRLVQSVPQCGVRLSMEAAVDGALNSSVYSVCVHQWDGDGNHIGLLNVPNPRFVAVLGNTGRQVISRTFTNPLGSVRGDVEFDADARYYAACFRAGILGTGDESFFNVLPPVEIIDGTMVVPHIYGPIGTADDTDAISAFLSAGGGYVPAGTYLIDDITVSNPCQVTMAVGALFKKRAGSSANSKLIKLVAGAEGSVFKNLTIDGNRTALQTAYDSVNASSPAYGSGWFNLSVECARVTFDDLTLQNCAGSPAFLPGDRLSIDGLTLDNYASAVIFGWLWFSSAGGPARPSGAGGYRQNINGVLSINYDNAGSNLFQHAIDFQKCEASRYTGFHIDEQDGDTSGGSAWMSGFTMERCEHCYFGGFKYTNPASDTLIHLGISMLGNIGCTVDSPVVDGIAGQAFEMNANVDCTISNVYLNGRFATSTAVPAGHSNSHGLTFFQGAWNEYRTSKSMAGNINCKIIGGTITGLSYGGFIRDHSVSIINVNIFGNLVDGLYLNEEVFDDHFAGAAQTISEISEISGCRIFNNGRAGITGEASDRMRVANNSIYNNGQDSGNSASTRAGVSLNDVENSHLAGNEIYDDQTWTIVNGASFEPAAASTTLEIYSVSLANMDVGQWVTIVGGGGGATDRTAKITNIGVDDLITLEAASAVTLSATGNRTTLTGTWSGGGVSLIGTGGAAIAELPGSYWVTDGTEWRRVTRVAGNNNIKLDRDFTTPLSGNTLDVLKVDLEGIPSQQYGVRAFGAALNMFYADNRVRGNVVKDEEISTTANMAFGSNYTRTTTTTINAANVNLMTQINEKHRLVGAAVRVDTVFSAGTSWSLVLRDAGSTLLDTLEAGIGITQNAKAEGVCGAASYFESGNKVLRCETTGGAPASGQVTMKAHFRVEAPDTLADV